MKEIIKVLKDLQQGKIEKLTPKQKKAVEEHIERLKRQEKAKTYKKTSIKDFRNSYSDGTSNAFYAVYDRQTGEMVINSAFRKGKTKVTALI